MNLEKGFKIPAAEQKGYQERSDKLARKENSLIHNILGKGIKGEDIARVDAEIENKTRDKGDKVQIEKVANSDLISRFSGDYEFIEGKINGHDVKLKRSDQFFLDGTETGSVDGIELTQAEAKEIFDEYSKIAEKRAKDISIAKRDIVRE